MEINKILEAYKNGEIDEKKASEKLMQARTIDLAYARLDIDRVSRRGYPEAIYCAGKTDEQVCEIFLSMSKNHSTIIGTKATVDQYRFVKEKVKVKYDNVSRLLYSAHAAIEKTGSVAVICAGTSDLPVAEEASLTAELSGCNVTKVYDVGVAGLHRLLGKLSGLDDASVIIVVAGMDGALPAVVSGLVSVPVIAVPTSIGYGTGTGGLGAMISMLNSCSPGVSVVNIDNGFGAGYLAAMINERDCR